VKTATSKTKTLVCWLNPYFQNTIRENLWSRPTSYPSMFGTYSLARHVHLFSGYRVSSPFGISEVDFCLREKFGKGL
jgi:hypothetical protein